jgi:hypothetical protein
VRLMAAAPPATADCSRLGAIHTQALGLFFPCSSLRKLAALLALLNNWSDGSDHLERNATTMESAQVKIAAMAPVN